MARALAAAALVVASAAVPCARGNVQTQVERGTLDEIKSQRRAALLVFRTQTVDARDPARVAVEHYRRVLKGGPPRMHMNGQRAAARLLNDYIRKYQSISAVQGVGEADFVVIFNVQRVRGSFIPQEPYIFGRLYVVARPPRPDASPRVVWESEEFESPLEEAFRDFIKDFKASRGEK